MTDHLDLQLDELDEDGVMRLAQLAGVVLPSQRVPLVTRELRQFLLSATFRTLDTSPVAIPPAFDPSW